MAKRKKQDCPVDVPFEEMTGKQRFEYYLWKKCMGKSPEAIRQTRHYYWKKYQETGEIPRGLLLPEGRKLSGPSRQLPAEIADRFREMVIASTKVDAPGCIYITRKRRKVVVYHQLLEREFGKKISKAALYRMVKAENLKYWLELPDEKNEENHEKPETYFNPVAVFDLIQMDGCKMEIFEIKDENGAWRAPQVIELFDTGSRCLFALDFYFSESSYNSIDIFSQFLKNTRFPNKHMTLRADNAPGFKNLKRPVRELNKKYSTTRDGFFIDAKESRAYRPKDKVHLESSHRALHNFEPLILMAFSDRIAETKTKPDFKGNRPQDIVTVTRIDITIEELRASGVIQEYLDQWNNSPHSFSEAGKTVRWTPSEKLADYLAGYGDQFTVVSGRDIDDLLKYGYPKERYTVTRHGKITYKSREYLVNAPTLFSTQRGTKVRCSFIGGELAVFEDREDGTYLCQALPKQASVLPEGIKKSQAKRADASEFDRIVAYLAKQGVDLGEAQAEQLLEHYSQGLSLDAVISVFTENAEKYGKYRDNPRINKTQAGNVIFGFFIADILELNQKNGGKRRVNG